MKRLLLISTWFQLLWFVAVLGTADWQWVLLMAVVYTIGLAPPNSFKNYMMVFAIGVVLDGLNSAFGLFLFPTAYIPIWLIGLWGIFAWYASYLVLFVSQYPRYVVNIVGGIAGAMSYIAGEKLGAVQLGYDLPVVGIVLFVQWSCLTAVIMRIYSNDEETYVPGITDDVASDSDPRK